MMKTMKARTMAMMLGVGRISKAVRLRVEVDEEVRQGTYIRYGKTTLFLNVFAIQIRLSGSWSMLTCSARRVALLEHRNAPPSGLMQRPK